MEQVAVVTGGNRGIGFEIARACVRAGFRVILTARDTSRGHWAAKVLGCDFVFLDLDDVESIKRCASEIARRYGYIDALINNASIKTRHDDPTPFVEKARAEVNTNFFGTLAVCEALFPLLRAGGRVVNMASSGGHLALLPSEVRRRQFAAADSALTVPQLAQLMSQFVADVAQSRSLAHAPAGPALDWPHVAKGWPNTAYGMSKLGQIALTKIHARMLAPHGISVNCCCPGSVFTGLNPGGEESKCGLTSEVKRRMTTAMLTRQRIQTTHSDIAPNRIMGLNSANLGLGSVIRRFLMFLSSFEASASKSAYILMFSIGQTDAQREGLDIGDLSFEPWLGKQPEQASQAQA